MARIFERNEFGLPDVDFPDWDLITKLDELFSEKALPGTLRAFRAWDSRGSYFADDLESFRKEVETQEETPKSLQLSMEANEPGTGTYRHFVVTITPTKRGQNLSAAKFSSGDEATVVHLASRTADLFRLAAERRERRVEAARRETGTSTSQRPATTPSPPERWWRIYAKQIALGVIIAVIGGLVVAAVVGLLS